MFTDVVGFTASAQSNEALALHRLQEEQGLVRALFPPYGGREVKSTGDGFLVEFESALKATECAIEIQRSLHERNSQSSDSPIHLRIGIHVGDVEEMGGDILGDAVNVASRVMPLADPGGVCLSELVFAHVRNKIALPLEKMGPRWLKGVRDPVEVYRVVLPWFVRPSPTEGPLPPRLAVLPLASISPDPNDAYFADGLTEELTSVLSKVRGLRVIARTSVGRYTSTSESIPQIGEELGVSSILEGSVRKAGRRIRVTMQLIDVASQEHIWSESYDREVDDVFAIQGEVAKRTALALRVELLSSDRDVLSRRPTSSVEAYDLYLRGIHALRASTEESLPQRVTEAMECFEAAIQTDPKFSLAYSYLANTLVGGVEDRIPPREANLRAKELADTALELDPDSSDAHTARGNVARWLDLDWGLAEAELRKAIALNPSNSIAHFCYGMLLRTLQRYEAAKTELRSAIDLEFDESRAELRSSVEFDPLDYGAPAWLAEVHCRLGECDSAISLAIQRLQEAPEEHRYHVALGWAYAASGRWEDARAEASLSAGPASRWVRLCRASLLAVLGSSEEARRLRSEWSDEAKSTYLPPAWRAGLDAILGDPDGALALLERDVREGDRLLSSVYEWEFYDRIRGDPRFAALLHQMNLPATVGWRRVEAAPPTSEPAPASPSLGSSRNETMTPTDSWRVVGP